MTDRADNLWLPWQVPVHVFGTPAAVTSWATFTPSNVYYFGGILSNGGIQNSLLSFDVVLGAGTWTLDWMGRTDSTRGIATFDLDGQALTAFGGSATTMDWYSAAQTNAVLSSITGIVLPVTAKRRLTITMATKNASASAYGAALSGLSFTRTA